MTEAKWYTDAKAQCASEGHPHIADGRCVRCRDYSQEDRPKYKWELEDVNVGLDEHQERAVASLHHALHVY